MHNWRPFGLCLFTLDFGFFISFSEEDGTKYSLQSDAVGTTKVGSFYQKGSPSMVVGPSIIGFILIIIFYYDFGFSTEYYYGECSDFIIRHAKSSRIISLANHFE